MAVTNLVVRSAAHALLACSALLLGGFAPVQTPPTITSVTPSSGPAAGGTTITVTGTNLTGATGVLVGGGLATAVTVVDANTVTAVTPAGTGQQQIRVTTPAGTAVLLGSVFTYIAAPTITAPNGVLPSTGPTVGGMPFSVSGTNFTGATDVKVGGVSATSIVVVSATTITAISPAGTVGPKAVSVTTPGGTATTLPANGMTLSNVAVPDWATPLEVVPNTTVVTNASIRTAITAQQRPWRVRDDQTGIEFVLIPPGLYAMGCSASDAYPCAANEFPIHTESVLPAWYMSRTEITQAQWTAQMGSNPSTFRSNSAAVTLSSVPNRPVERVSFVAIQDFLTKTGTRLPTEPEWEYAYRALTTNAFHGYPATPNGTNDDAKLIDIAWCSRNSIYQTRPVGQLAPNGFGLFDMSGNVAEWVSDVYEPYLSDSFGGSGPGPIGNAARVVRGGAWNNNSNNCRASRRLAYRPTVRMSNLGFRVVKEP